MEPKEISHLCCARPEEGCLGPTLPGNKEGGRIGEEEETISSTLIRARIASFKLLSSEAWAMEARRGSAILSWVLCLAASVAGQCISMWEIFSGSSSP